MLIPKDLALELLDVLVKIEEKADDPCPVLCVARDLICSNPDLPDECEAITTLCAEAGCDCGGTQ